MHKLHPIRASFAERFWKHVQKTDGCWLWTGALDKHRRGRLRLGRASKGQIQAHRASWIVHFGTVPIGKSVLHHCDNGQCVRPDHLYLGTQQDNMKDVQKRGRHWLLRKGGLIAADKNPNAKLGWEDVKAIRESFSNGISGAALARQNGVTKENIYHIVHRRCWIEP